MKNAFTLAEVLITLGIIGVAAAMTMPSLIAEHKEKSTIARLKKVYSVLDNAYMLARNENMDVSSWFGEDNIKVNSKIFFNNIKPYLKIIKDCGFEEGCLTDGSVKTLDGRDYNEYNKNRQEYRFVLADGTQVMIMLNIYDNSDINNFGNIKVDIDGYRGGYTFGKDVFIFDIKTTGIYPAGMKDDPNYQFKDFCNKSKSTDANGRACTAWVIFNENMDYLHCNDLDWSTKIKCK